MIIWNLLVFNHDIKDKSPLNMQDFTLTTEFYPSTIEPCRIILQKKGDTVSISIYNIYGYKIEDSKEKEGLLIEKSNTLLVDEYYLQFWGDTFFLKPIENSTISPKDFQRFKNDLLTIDFAQQKSLMKENIFSNMAVYFRFQADAIDNRFRFINPQKQDASEFQIITAIFNIIESYFTTTDNNYIAHLKKYFDFGLPVKHISNNPLEYKLYNYLSANEADEFYKFMKNLPIDRPIVFDLSDFKGMAPSFYLEFEELINKNNCVYWIADDRSQKQILMLGAKPERIFKDRQELLKKIKNVPNN